MGSIYRGITSITSIVIVTLAICVANPARAEDTTKRLKEVVVQATDEKEAIISGAVGKPLAEFSGAATVIPQEEISATKPLSTIDVLQSVPGVNVTTEDGRGLRPNIGLRGIDPDRSREGVLITADGVPIQPAVYGDKSAYYNTPIDLIEKIEIIKGASSVLYGPGNVGGVVNYVTKRPPSEAGSEGQFNQTVRQGALSDTTIAYGATGEKGVGSRVSYTNKIGETVRENTDTNVNDFNIRTIIPTDDKGEISLRFNYYLEDIHTPGGLSPEQFREDPDQSIRSDDVFRGNRIAFDVNYIQPLASDITLETLIYSNFFERNWYIQDAPDATATKNSQILRDFTVVGIEPRLRIGKWTVGTRLHHEGLSDVSRAGDSPSARTGITTADADLETFAWASYVQRDIELIENLTITPGVRYEYIDQSRETGLRNDALLGPIAGESGDSLTEEVVGAVTFNYKLTDDGNIYGGVQRSFEPPAFSESIDPTTGTDNDLDSETAITYEIGYRTVVSDWLAADASVFLLDFEDKIISEAGKLSNAGETRHKGFELGLTGTPTDRLTTSLALTVLDTEFRSGVNSGNDTPMAPESRVSWGVSYRVIEPLTVRIDGFYVADQYTDAANTVEESLDGAKGRLPSYDVWNLRGDYAIGELIGFENVSLFGGIQNLFDEEYRERRQAFFNGIIPGLTRTVYGGLEVRF